MGPDRSTASTYGACRARARPAGVGGGDRVDASSAARRAHGGTHPERRLWAAEERRAELDALGAECERGGDPAAVHDPARVHNGNRDAVDDLGHERHAAHERALEGRPGTCRGGRPPRRPARRPRRRRAPRAPRPRPAVVAVPRTMHPVSLTASRGGRPKVKLKTGTRSSATTAIWSSTVKGGGGTGASGGGSPSSSRNRERTAFIAAIAPASTGGAGAGRRG